MNLLTSLLELRNYLGTHILFTLGVMLLSGYLFGRLCGRFKLPEITGFIFAGIVLGQSLLGIVPYHMTASMKVITEVALGLIALTIGSEFSLVKLRRLGKEVLSITAVQLLFVFLTVSITLYLIGMALPFALILGSIATASSPAVIVAVVQSLRAHGTFIDYLYGVVALLDAGTVILFGISFSIAVGMMGLTAAGSSPVSLLLYAIFEVVLSVVAGIFMGFLMHLLIRKRYRDNEVLIITLGMAFLVTAVAIVYHLSPLLINMTAGAVLINITPRHHRVFKRLEPLTPPIYALFFVLAGAELRLSSVIQPQVLLFGLAYVLVRGLSKYGSTFFGAFISKAPGTVRTWLGLSLFPQAGVALGLVLMVQAAPSASLMTQGQLALSEMMVNIVLLSVFINQIIGPPVLKHAIIRGNSMEE